LRKEVKRKCFMGIRVGGVFLEKQGRPGGFASKGHLLPPPFIGNRGEGRGAPAPAIPGGPGSMAAPRVGEKEEGAKGTRFPHSP
jgi:hypothetical protein